MMTHHESLDSSLTLSVTLSQSLTAVDEEKYSKFQDFEMVECEKWKHFLPASTTLQRLGNE